MCPRYPQYEIGNEAISGGVIICSDGPPQDHIAGDLEGPSSQLPCCHRSQCLKLFASFFVAAGDKPH